MKLLKRALAGATIAGFMAISSQAAYSAPIEGDDWLHTQGNQIVDKDGNAVWLTGANWFGFNASERTFHGLWSVSLESTLQAIADRGINILRVPISTELLWEWRNGQFSVPNVNGSTNANLVGKTNLQVFDQFLAASKEIGLKVMLDVHSAEADNSGHVAPLWYKGAITPEIFYQSWEWVTERYKNDDTIIAMDIENEPHGQPWSGQDFAKWDNSTDINNFKHACETASKRVLAINPNVLVLCEGVEAYPVDGVTWTSTDRKQYHNTWWGGNLRGVKDLPIELGANQDQLVYSPHDYGPLVFQQPWFYDGFNRDTLYVDAWKDNWLYIHEDGIAPLLLGEWGGFMDSGDNEKWMFALRDQIVEDKLHHTFWVVNPNSGDTGGLLLNDWTTWDETKYALLKPALWQDAQGKFVGLDHEVPLGTSATGVSLSEFFGNQQPSVGISSPVANTQFTAGTSFNLNYGLNQLTNVNVYLNNILVTESHSSGSITINVPETFGVFTIELKAVDASGAELGIEAARTFEAIAEVVLLPAISISSPTTNSSVNSGSNFTVGVDYENAAGFSVTFNGQSQSVLDNNSVTLTAPTAVGDYALTVTAIDASQQALDASDTVNVEVVSVPVGELSCEAGSANTWPGGFTLDITVSNNSATAVSTWSADLSLASNVSISNVWNAVYSSANSTAANAPYNGNIAPGESVTFGMQGTYTGSFVTPTCSVN